MVFLLDLKTGEIFIQTSSVKTKIKVICFLISFILHAGFFYWLLHVRHTIDTDPFGWEVTNVFLSPRIERVNFPKKLVQEVFEPAVNDSQVDSKENKQETLPLRGDPPEKESPLSDSISYNFRLKLPEDYLTKLPEDYEFDLTIKEQILFPEYDYDQKNRTDISLDLNKYLYSGSGWRGGKTGGEGTAAVRHRWARPLSGKDHDISLWANEVVEKIQTNWNIQQEEIGTMDNPVEVSVIMKKNGKILSIGVVSSSNDENLDRSAINAIRMSLPLPELPEVFQEETLEILLVFAINE